MRKGVQEDLFYNTMKNPEEDSTSNLVERKEQSNNTTRDSIECITTGLSESSIKDSPKCRLSQGPENYSESWRQSTSSAGSSGFGSPPISPTFPSVSKDKHESLKRNSQEEPTHVTPIKKPKVRHAMRFSFTLESEDKTLGSRVWRDEPGKIVWIRFKEGPEGGPQSNSADSFGALEGLSVSLDRIKWFTLTSLRLQKEDESCSKNISVTFFNPESKKMYGTEWPTSCYTYEPSSSVVIVDCKTIVNSLKSIEEIGANAGPNFYFKFRKLVTS